MLEKRVKLFGAAILRLPCRRWALFLRSVNPVSNLVRGHDGAIAGGVTAGSVTTEGVPAARVSSGRMVQESTEANGVVWRQARADDVVPALCMILGVAGRAAEESQAADFMRFTATRGVSLSEMWVAEYGKTLLWAVLPMVSPGRTVLLFGAPAAFAGNTPAVVRETLERVCRHFGHHDIQLAQALIDPTDELTIDEYLDAGFQWMAELIYLQRSIRRTTAPPPLQEPFALHTYSAQMHSAFAAGISASYEQSLDCPPLNGRRGVEDIIAGHKAAGDFDPNDWFLLTHRDQPVAVLLLTCTTHGDGMELVYLGLAPDVRGQGLGDYLMRVAEARVVERKLNRLTLAVDSQNAPALRLYHRHGLRHVTRKVALMRELTAAP
jgi:mycothiol synthase